MTTINQTVTKTNYLVKIAVLAAVSAILMIFIEIPLPFFPAFLKLDISDLPALIGGFALGPMAAFLIALIKNFVHFVLKNDGTGGIGNLANFIVGAGFTVPAAMIYQHKKSIKGALMGMSVGIVAMALLGAAANYWLLIPAYAKLMPLEAIIAMASEANPNITDVKQYVLYAVIPFNIVKALVVSALTLPLYKRISHILHK